ncbi:DUF1476 domain-containing protein [Bradyrhizobium sp. 40]|jgi:hypothetical protein|uniref:DUF1476 domain-containing protein n=1 Tax=Bradyrhizobium sp. 40 TaxID=2782674 RepID=UPI001FFF41FB|nr:DUF1476 domain-containing protein [Bradyrhizobium sp. 40]UPJ44263.1 DUF1476 domain-containing protein [Bradyrhizobium sp. 40]
MADFSGRREAFERKFAHDETLRFKAIARRNKLFGLWVAAQLGKTGSDAETYADAVVVVDLEEPGDGDIIHKVMSDLKTAAVPIDEDQVRGALEGFIDRAVDEIKAGK